MKIDKTLSKPTKKQRKNIQNNKIRSEKGNITINTKKIQKIIRSYFKNLYLRKVENVKEIDNFLFVLNPSEGLKQVEKLALFVDPASTNCQSPLQMVNN